MADISITIPDEEYMQAMLAHMPVGVALFDAEDFSLLTANRLYHIFLDTFLSSQWRHGRALGHSFIEWLPGLEETGMVAIFSAVVETGIPYRAGEYEFPAFESGVTYWNWTLDPIRDAEGRIVQLVQTVVEVTAQVLARKRAEEAHNLLFLTNRGVEAERKRLAVIETVARSVRDSLSIEEISIAAIEAVRASFDAQYVSTHVANPQLRTLDLLDIRPLPPYDIFTLVQYVPYKSVFPLGQAYKQRDPIILEDIQLTSHPGNLPQDNLLVTSGARGCVCVPLWFGDCFEGTLTATFTEAIALDGPEVQALVGSSIHIAAAFAHARLHSAAENERVRLRIVLDQLPEGVLIVEAANGIVSYSNRAAEHILGIPVSELQGASLDRYSGTSEQVWDAKEHLNRPWNFMFICALSGETVSGQEIPVIRPNGQKVTILSSSAPLYSDFGLITGAVIVFQDISIQKSLEEQKNEFLSIASHELRTPITAIQGFAELLQMQAEQGRGLGPSGLHALAIINEQSHSLTCLIEEMLDLTRIENAKLNLHKASHALRQTLAQVVETQAASTRQHYLRLTLSGIAETDEVVGWFDKNRMMQVFSNLIGNAIKYSPGGGEIEVGLRYTSPACDEVLSWVKDCGIGIAASDLPHIFKRFHRSSRVDHSISGLGIGLYLVQELVTRHGGRIWAESIEGQGSTFYVQLPLSAQHKE